jgi:hypothetical protein
MLENLQGSINTEYLEKKSKKSKRDNMRLVLSGEESYHDAQGKIESALVDFNKKTGEFFCNADKLFGEEKGKKFIELISRRKKFVETLYEGVDKSLLLSYSEKRQLKFDVDLFVIFHNFYERVLFEIDRFDQNSFRIPAEQYRKITSQNLDNKASAEAQQYIAMALITNGRFSIEQMRARSREIQTLYPIPNGESVEREFHQEQNPEEVIKKGIYGLTAAYFYYQKKGYRVLFPNPSVDANQKIDLFLIKTDEMDSRQRAKFFKVDFEKIQDIEKIPKSLRSFITLVQIKCHGDKSGRKSSEIVYKKDYIQEVAESINQEVIKNNFEKYKEEHKAKGVDVEYLEQSDSNRWAFGNAEEIKRPKTISMKGI